MRGGGSNPNPLGRPPKPYRKVFGISKTSKSVGPTSLDFQNFQKQFWFERLDFLKFPKPFGLNILNLIPFPTFSNIVSGIFSRSKCSKTFKETFWNFQISPSKKNCKKEISNHRPKPGPGLGALARGAGGPGGAQGPFPGPGPWGLGRRAGSPWARAQGQGPGSGP